MNRRYILLLLLLLLLLCHTACSAQDERVEHSDVVTCITPLSEDEFVPEIQMSDGFLVFDTSSWYTPHISYIIPENAEYVDITREEWAEYAELDPVTDLSGLPERIRPQEEDMVLQCVFRLTEDIPEIQFWTTRFSMSAGSYWAGVEYIISEAMSESAEELPQSRKIEVTIGLTGEFIARRLKPSIAECERLSRVGEIPLYVSYEWWEPAVGKATDTYYAYFDVPGHCVAIYTRGYTQQEFVDTLLAIINHYGAYPET